jgi:hypothetical protein
MLHAPNDPGFLAGAAKIEVTPSVGCWLEGIPRAQPSDAIHDPLHARALVCEDEAVPGHFRSISSDWPTATWVTSPRPKRVPRADMPLTSAPAPTSRSTPRTSFATVPVTCFAHWKNMSGLVAEAGPGRAGDVGPETGGAVREPQRRHLTVKVARHPGSQKGGGPQHNAVVVENPRLCGCDSCLIGS